MKKKKMFFYGITATLQTRRESHCLPYVGFFEKICLLSVESYALKKHKLFI